MRCTTCDNDNPPDALFCQGCGRRLELRCPACGAANSGDANFCKKCGTRLTADPSSNTVSANAQEALARSPTHDPAVKLAAPLSDIIDGERKTVTALFADLKGSTELMADLDPEEARAIIDPALKLMIDAVHRYDGYIVQSTGDGIFALFGAPVAHEEHPQRALYAALRMQEGVKSYSAKLVADGGTPIEARVGVNTGEVVVRSIQTSEGHTEYTPIGHTINLAARMQAVAPTGSIAITESTRQLVEGYFQLKSRGPTRVKGVAELVNVFEVTGLGPLRTRLQRSVGRGLTRFVGRDAELAQMRLALELVREGHGQIVAAMGEPGVGKSRLFFEFKAVAQSGCLVLEAYSVSHGKASAYLPVIDLLRNYFEITAEDDERKRREKVAGKVVILDRALEDTLPYLYSLLGMNESDDPLAPLDPQTRRRRTLEAIKRILVRESLSQLLIVEFEDLHWIDSETQALLNLLVDGIATARILLLVNYRPEYHHQWGSKTYYSQLRLDPLGKETAQELLTALMGDDESTLPLKRLIIERTEGNPFFMEEIVQALVEQGVLARNGAVKLVKHLNEIRVPPTVQAILASRIDRLSAAEKDLLQTLAVLGSEFPLGLIKRMVARPDDELERLVSDLQVGEFIYEQPAIADIEYTFKHALTQEVAYNSVLSQRRRILHERAAGAIEALFSDRLEDHLAELAHHYDRSGNMIKAVEYLGRTGQRAAQQTAHSEAIGYLSRALELLNQLPANRDRDHQEVDLNIALSWSLFVARGPQVPEREPVLVRALEVCERLGDNARLMETLSALALFHVVRRDYGRGREMAQRVLDLGRAAKADSTVAGAHYLLGITSDWLGQLEAAREHLELAVALFGPSPFRNFAEMQYSQAAAAALTTVLCMLGYPAAALRKSGELLAAVRRLSDPASLARVLNRDAVLHTELGNSRSALERAEELISIATEHGLAFYAATGLFHRSWALAHESRQEGIAGMCRAISEHGPTPARALMKAHLAESYGKNGRPKEGLAAVAEGLGDAQQSGEKLIEAGLYRAKGELLLMDDQPDEEQAERCFRAAIEIDRNQKARFPELRATASLARLLKRQGKAEEARKILAEIYNWFTEGFDTADLKDAKALLEELAQ